jgi:DNA segregation ATPase FtsK/SpoIIIE-like protein
VFGEESAKNLASMDYLAMIFVPGGNRRLNELIGFLLCVSALLLLLALVSYSPLDPSWNSASVLNSAHAARNWIGIVGAYTADATLQFFGVGAFLLVLFPTALAVRWFRSMKVQAPLAKILGAVWLLMFVPAMLALLPGHVLWAHVIPVEGLLGRVVGDVLIHYLNLVGAYIVCGTVLATALGSHQVFFCYRALGPLQGLAARARPQAPAERARAAAQRQTCREDAAHPVASGTALAAACGRTAAHRD